jgi:hypothetical protein
MLIKILVSFGSIITAGFGVWHFFVPKLWDWYSYIASQATELVAAVRAINIFFSLCLVLIGVADMLFVYFQPNRFPLIVMLSVSVILWAVRCLMQILYPQGSISPMLQYGMLSAFMIVLICFLASLLLVIFNKQMVK